MNNAYPGFFIVLEGLDGCGKGTQAKPLVRYLEGAGNTVVHTFEPGGTPIANDLRKIFLQKRDDDKLEDHAEALLMASMRRQHVITKIKPAIAAGHVVLSERFFQSTLAYQGGGRGMSRHVLSSIISLSCDDVQPDLVIVLDISAEVSMERKRKAVQEGSSAPLDTFESEKLEFHRRVREVYLQLAASGEPYLLVDGTMRIDQIFEVILGAVNERMAQKFLANSK